MPMPATTAASAAFSTGRSTPFSPRLFASSAMESAPLTGLTFPSSDNSPARIKLPSKRGLIAPSAAIIPTAIGRSKDEPSFLRSAGARLTVICFKGKLKPIFFRAAFILSRLSLTAASGSPTIEKCGSPFDEISTSTSTRCASMPITCALRTLESISFSKPLFYIADDFLPAFAPIGGDQYGVWCCCEKTLQHDTGSEPFYEVNEKIEVFIIIKGRERFPQISRGKRRIFYYLKLMNFQKTDRKS